MTKIPVGKTIAFAYGFAFGDFLTVLGIVWLPLGLALVLSYFAMTQGWNNVGGMMQAGDFGAAQGAMRSLVLFGAAVLILQSVATVGVTTQALGLRNGSPIVYFSLGAPVWRLVGAYILVFLLFIVFEIVFAIGAVLLGLLAGVVIAAVASASGTHSGLSTATIVLLAVIGVAAFVGALLYIGARLVYLIAPVVVAEHKIDLTRGWTLTKGNFWRIVAIVLAIFIPLGIVSGTASILLYGSDMFPPMQAIMQHASDQKMVQQLTDTWSRNLQTRMGDIWLIAYPVQFAISVLTTALSAGAAAFAYRALVPPKKQEPDAQHEPANTGPMSA